MKIALGSTSEQKHEYLAATLGDLRLADSGIVRVEVESGVSEQPLTSAETLAGSSRRARKAYDKSAGADCAIGIEVGFELNAGQRYEIMCWATVYDGAKEYSCQSNRFLLPEYHQEKLRAGSYLGDHVREYAAGASGVKAILGGIIIDRDTIIKNAIYHTLLYYLNREEY